MINTETYRPNAPEIKSEVVLYQKRSLLINKRFKKNAAVKRTTARILNFLAAEKRLRIIMENIIKEMSNICCSREVTKFKNLACKGYATNIFPRIAKKLAKTSNFPSKIDLNTDPTPEDPMLSTMYL